MNSKYAEGTSYTIMLFYADSHAESNNSRKGVFCYKVFTVDFMVRFNVKSTTLALG